MSVQLLGSQASFLLLKCSAADYAANPLQISTGSLPHNPERALKYVQILSTAQECFHLHVHCDYTTYEPLVLFILTSWFPFKTEPCPLCQVCVQERILTDPIAFKGLFDSRNEAEDLSLL